MPNSQPVPAFIERLERSRTDALSTIDAVLARAGEDDRDLTETEDATLADARGRLERADSQRGEWAELLERRAAGDELGARVSGALARSSQVARPEVLGGRDDHDRDPGAELQRLFRSPGDYVHAYVQEARGMPVDDRLQRAVANQLVADNLGIVPTPIIGPVVSLILRARPSVSSVMNRPLPGGGRSFLRPKVTQHTTAGVQAAEKTELVSQKMTITPLNVNKQTYGGTLDISFQDRDWTEPAILQIVIDDMAIVYARATNAGFATAFAASVTGAQAVTTPVDGPKLQAAIATAAGSINAATGLMPDTLWCSPDVWAQIASLTDTTGRALFATIGPMNASGVVPVGGQSYFNGNVFGLNVIVDAAFAATTLIVGIASLAEFYETIGGQLSVTEPSILGFLVAFYGYVAWCFPAPEAFVKLTGMTGLALDVQSADDDDAKRASK